MRQLVRFLLRLSLTLLVVLAILTAPALFVFEEGAHAVNIHGPITALSDFITEMGSEDFLLVMFGRTPRNMMEFIPDFARVSFLHLAAASVISLLTGIGLGVFFGTRTRRFGLGGLTLLSAIPDFILVMVLQLLMVLSFQHFGIRLGYINYSSREGILGFPLIILIIISLSYVARTVAQKMAQVSTEDYVLYAKARGLSKGVIIFRYMLTAVLSEFRGDLIKLVSITVGSLFIVERMFSIPGLTRLLFNFGFDIEFSSFRGISAYTINFRIALTAIILIAAISTATYLICSIVIFILKRICSYESLIL